MGKKGKELETIEQKKKLLGKALATVTEKRSAGRPFREFDHKIVEGLCHVLCTFQEIESVLRCNMVTLNTWCMRFYGESFIEVYKRFSDGGKASLRRYQFNLARTNAAMAIWLGKQWLGQREFVHEDERFSGELKEFIEFLKRKYSGSSEHKLDKKIEEGKGLSKHSPNKMVDWLPKKEGEKVEEKVGVEVDAGS